jgi:transcriptional regulator
MYTPDHFRETDPRQAYDFMAAHPFGLIVTAPPDGPFISHAPFLVNPESATIQWHLAAANPQVAQLVAGVAAKLVFLGPHAYISPRWYTSPNVPTWNFAAVHVTGRVQALATSRTADIVAALSRQYEGPAGLGEFEHSPLYQRLLGAICGFELVVTEVTAKFKLSQNRPLVDQANVAARLSAGDEQARAIGAMMHANLIA